MKEEFSTPPEEIIEAAIKASKNSSCQKSNRGSVLFNIVNPKTPFALGWNHPIGVSCSGSDTCKKICNQICIHAEQHSLNQIHKYFDVLTHGWHLVHVKTINGKLVVSGPPSCWQCSRLILDIGIFEKVWLFHEIGWKSYTPKDFHQMTLEKCHLLEEK